VLDPTSVVMPAVAVVAMMVVEMLDPNQPRLAAVVVLGPGSVAVTVARRIGIVRAGCFGAGRKSSQQDY
jgi:hypothetical protein